jgi:hypothetical protein
LLLAILRSPDFVAGNYAADFLTRPLDPKPATEIETLRRALAVAVALQYRRRREAVMPQTPDQMTTGWHRSIRRVPQGG